MHDLLDGLDVVTVRGDVDVDVRSVVHDSRDVAPGALFACIRGASPMATRTRRPRPARAPSGCS